MKKLLNTLFVTSEDAYLTLDGENVVVNREKQVTARFPLHALAGIISFSYAGASPALMGACAKRAGAWIEILHVSRAAELGRVAPFTGAWIEIAVVFGASCSLMSLLLRIDTDSRTTILPPNLAPVPIPHNLSPTPTKTFAHVMTHVL